MRILCPALAPLAAFWRIRRTALFFSTQAVLQRRKFAPVVHRVDSSRQEPQNVTTGCSSWKTASNAASGSKSAYRIRRGDRHAEMMGQNFGGIAVSLRTPPKSIGQGIADSQNNQGPKRPALVRG